MHHSPILFFAGEVRKVSRIGESPVPSSFYRAPGTIEIDAEPSNSASSGAKSINSGAKNKGRKGLGTSFFSAVSCLSVRDAGSSSGGMVGGEGEKCYGIDVALCRFMPF